ncbi:hypothetical protein [Nocardia amamiensis]|uniref:hypothetical protein n=1 Tax=Nocardia amamiensis TaxID=404578 RepID=UPI0008342152|nr:hypothetical protein [Nocardia amamiensis]
MELRAFLWRCFELPESDIFVSSDDLADEALQDFHRDGPFPVFCTYRPVGGDFAAAFSLSADPPLSGPDAPDSQGFVVLLAAQIGCDILCSFGDEPQPWLWTLTRSDGARVIVHLAEEFDGFDGEPPCACEYAHRKVVYPKS